MVVVLHKIDYYVLPLVTSPPTICKMLPKPGNFGNFAQMIIPANVIGARFVARIRTCCSSPPPHACEPRKTQIGSAKFQTHFPRPRSTSSADLKFLPNADQILEGWFSAASTPIVVVCWFFVCALCVYCSLRKVCCFSM